MTGTPGKDTKAPSDNRENALQVERLEDPLNVGDSGIVLHTANDVWAIAKGICAAKMAPASLDTPDKVAVAILTGAEAGLSPMMSVKSIYVVNGAPAWLTKAARALVLNSGKLKGGTTIEEGVEHAANCPAADPAQRCVDECCGYCQTHRVGEAVPHKHRFRVADAKRAKLWDKKGRSGAPGPWQLYPDRMLMHRAAGMHFDDRWSDLLMGLTTVEVLQDLPPAAFVRDGETVATYSEPPGVDPLLAPASGAATVIEPEEGAGAPVTGEEPDAAPEPAPSVEEDEEPEPSFHGVPDEDAAEREAVEAEIAARNAELEPPVCADPNPEPSGGGETNDEPLPIYCEADGCRRKIDPETDVRWTTPTGVRCAACGPLPQEK